MKFFKIVVGAASVALVILPQIALARTPAENKYLANVEHIAKTSGDRKLARVHASKTTSYRLQYGYGVCLALDRGKTLNDLNSNIAFNGKTSVSEKTYAIAMQSFAIHDFCPEYKPLLSK